MRSVSAFATTGFVAAAALALSVASSSADDAAIPDFQTGNMGWIAMSPDLIPPATGPKPVTFDPAHRYVPNGRGEQATFRIADTTNPILKSWAAERMKKDNTDVLGGKIAFTARSSCMPAGVPGFEHYIVEPIFFVQSPKQVLIIYAGNEEVRRVYMNVGHSKNPKPSWYGESVGRYEGDTLVVDTIGFNDRTYVDNYRTPHTEKLHVVERFRKINDGKNLGVDIRVEDPDAFTTPWSASQRYRRVTDIPIGEQICAESNANNALFDYHVPVANKPDF